MKRTLAFLPLAVVVLVAATVACNKVIPTVPTTPAGNSTTVNGSNAKQIPKAWDVAFGRSKECFYGSGGCLISTTTAMVVPGGQEALADGDITPDGHLLLSVHLDMLDPAIKNELIATQQFVFDHDVVIPQDGLNELCDKQNPSIPHWGGPVGISVGTYPLPVFNGGADQILEMEGIYDSASNSWNWEFHIH
jgi:hypothetical protein